MIDGDNESSPIGTYERDVIMTQLASEMQVLIQKLGRSNMGKIPNFLLYLEPRCLWCYRTKGHIPATQLLNCPDCLGATYCSPDHMEKGRAAHAMHMYDNGLTQVCKISASSLLFLLFFKMALRLLFVNVLVQNLSEMQRGRFFLAVSCLFRLGVIRDEN